MARQKLMLCWIGIKISESRLLTIILVLTLTVFFIQSSYLFQRVLQSYPRTKLPRHTRYIEDNSYDSFKSKHDAELLQAEDELWNQISKRALDTQKQVPAKKPSKIVIDLNINKFSDKKPNDAQNDVKDEKDIKGNKEVQPVHDSVNKIENDNHDSIKNNVNAFNKVKQPVPNNNANNPSDNKNVNAADKAGKPVGPKDNKDVKIIIQYFIYTFQDARNEHKVTTFKPTPILHEHLEDPVSSYNGNMSVHSPNPMAFLPVAGAKIYMMSAFEGFSIINKTSGQPNVTDDRMSFYDINTNKYDKADKALVGQKHIGINAWLVYDLVQENLTCCVLLKNKSVISYLSTQRIAWYMCKKQPLMATKVFCPIPDRVPFGEEPVGILLAPPALGCYSRIFMKIEHAKKREQYSLAICAKLAYGELSAHRVIEWMETQRYLGVDKVIYYFYNLNKETMKVLKHYMKEGFVDLLPFDIPQPADPKRDVGQKQGQPYSDEQVATYDCIERLKGYNYVAVIDVDEYIYARNAKDHNLKTFLKMSAKRYPDASGFSFATEMFVTDWYNNTNITTNIGAVIEWPKSELWHSKYRIRTQAMIDRVKSIVNIDRIVLGSVWTHNYTSLPTYKNYILPFGHATLKHFRACRPQWVEDHSCFKLPKYKDVSMAKLMYPIKDRILQKKKKLLGS